MSQRRYQKKEDTIHQHVCDYLRLQHKGVIFRTDFAAGIKMTMGQAAKHKRLQASRAYPDLFIAEPKGLYHGLFLELKKDGTRLKCVQDGSKRKKGDWATDHLQEQADMIVKLRERGYCAAFAVGFDQAKDLIDRYLA